MKVKKSIHLYFKGATIFVDDLRKWDVKGQYVDMYRDGKYLGYIRNFKFKKYCDFTIDGVKAYSVIFK